MKDTVFKITFRNGETASVSLTPKNDNFDLTIKLSKGHNTLVPLGIPNFEGVPENATLEFEMTIKENGIDDFTIEFIHNEEVMQSYFSSQQALDEVVVTAKGSGNSPESDTAATKEVQSNYPKGTYTIKWDGFDSKGIYDSTIFTTGKLKARVRGRKNGEEKIAETEDFSFEQKIKWLDTKITKNSKRIDVTLRVNLTDGGAKGTENECYELGKSRRAPVIKICPWDKIPKKDLLSSKSHLETQTKKFEDLEKLALEGLNYHWGRNEKHHLAKNVDVNGEKYEVFVNAINTTENAMDDVKLVFNTNGKWLRSMNPGSVSGVISFFGQVMPERIVYNYGYMKGENKWYWLGKNVEDVDGDFSYTSAHEIGHEILKSFSGKAFHSYKHKASSCLLYTSPSPRD